MFMYIYVIFIPLKVSPLPASSCKSSWKINSNQYMILSSHIVFITFHSLNQTRRYKSSSWTSKSAQLLKFEPTFITIILFKKFMFLILKKFKNVITRIRNFSTLFWVFHWYMSFQAEPRYYRNGNVTETGCKSKTQLFSFSFSHYFYIFVILFYFVFVIDFFCFIIFAIFHFIFRLFVMLRNS